MKRSIVPLLAVLALVGCAQSVSVPVSRPMLVAAEHGSSVPTGHLYTIDDSTVDAYPLKNGFPVTKGLRSFKDTYPLSVTIGPSGEVFVVNYWRLNGRQYQYTTHVFAAGASGNPTPIRSFWSDMGPSIAVDSSGYTYEGGLKLHFRGKGWDHVAEIFAPDASGHARHLKEFDAGALSIGFDAQGNAYFDGGIYSGKWVTVFANPLTNPQQISRFCWAPKDATSLGMAVAPDGTTYVATDDVGGSQPLPGRVLVFAPGENHCPATPIRIISATDIPFLSILGIALSGSYLYVKDEAGYIVVMDPTKGAQVPLSRLTISNSLGGEGLAIGP